MMPSSPHQSSPTGGLGPGRRNRRSTSDISSAAKEGKKWSFTAAFGNSKKPSTSDANIFPGSLPSFADPVIANNIRQLQKYSSKIQNATKNVDSAWDEYVKIRERCLEICKSLMTPPVPRRESSVVSPTTLVSPKSENQRDHSFDTLSLVAVETGSSSQSSSSRVDPSLHLGPRSAECQKAARGWQSSIELLANTLRTSLLETYNTYDRDPTPEGFERICIDKKARYNTIYHMRSANISRMMSADLDFFPKYDVRFRNYDEIKKDLVKVQSILGTSGIPQSRTIVERCISPTGDVMLEFANTASEQHPVFRFRVASHCLRETSSPIFGHMFNAHFRAELDDDLQRSLPLPPSKYVCADGSEVMLYRMPQTEPNTERSLEVLLHAAHNHYDRVPRDVQFSQFVAIAEACLRYRCTSPLEMAVEHMWLPYWRDHATEDMLADVLLISYVFGLPENFTRLSRLAILGMTKTGMNWLPKVAEKIDAVRRAKIEQVYERCRMTLNEFLYPAPLTNINPKAQNRLQTGQPSGVRCPRGDRTCDAQNLGWYMKTLADLGMLPAILPSSAPLFPKSQAPQTEQSLLGIIGSLCLMTSPPQSHGGVCDFAPAFRDALGDIYKSVAGLTLYDVSGKRGWALSKNRSPRQSTQDKGGVVEEQLFKFATQKQQQYVPADRNTFTAALRIVRDRKGGGTTTDDWPREDEEADDGNHDCYLRILRLLGDARDLHAAAMINRGFYRCYLRNKTALLEKVGVGGPLIDGSIAEVEGTPCGAGPSHEKFKNGQLLVMEGKSLVEGDTNKYPRDIRGGLVGLSIKGAGLGQASWPMEWNDNED